MVDLEIAINENDLATLSFEVEDYVDRLSSIFDKYDMVFNRLNGVYKSTSCKKIYNYYENVKKSFPVVKSNIKSYASDYIELIQILKSEDRKFSGIIDSLTSDKETQAKNIRVENTKNTFI